MILLDELQAVWRQIKVPVHGQQIDARELSTVNLQYGCPLVTIDEYEYRHLLIPIPDALEIQSDTKSDGIQVTAEFWGISDHVKRYLDIRCLKPHLSDLFSLITLDVLDGLMEGGAHPDQSTHTVLERWRDLILGAPRNLPHRRQIIGLFGELWFLRELTRHNARAIDAWKGPAGERYDFYTGKTAVEVKASTQISHPTATIHGHMQLEPPPNGDLYFVHIQLESAQTAKESLQSLINELVELDIDQRKLYTILVQLGFSSDVLAKINSTRFNVISFSFYQVNDKFPKIIAASFSEGKLPAGVNEIQYKIDLRRVPVLSQPEYNRVIQSFLGELGNAFIP